VAQKSKLVCQYSKYVIGLTAPVSPLNYDRQQFTKLGRGLCCASCSGLRAGTPKLCWAGWTCWWRWSFAVGSVRCLMEWRSHARLVTLSLLSSTVGARPGRAIIECCIALLFLPSRAPLH